MVHEKRWRIGGRKWFYGLQSFLIVSALVIDLDIREGAGRLDELLGALKHPDLISLILFLLFLHLLYVSEKRKESRPDGRMKKLCICLPAAFFAFSMVFGYSFYKCNSWELVFGSSVQFVKSCIAFAGYYCLFHAGIVLLYDQADHALFRGDANKQKGIVGYYMEYLETYPFRTAFLTCLLAFLPYMILSYPGIFTCDTKIQIDNGYGTLVHGSVHLRNQHPVIHVWKCQWRHLFPVSSAIFADRRSCRMDNPLSGPMPGFAESIDGGSGVFCSEPTDSELSVSAGKRCVVCAVSDAFCSGISPGADGKI